MNEPYKPIWQYDKASPEFQERLRYAQHLKELVEIEKIKIQDMEELLLKERQFLSSIETDLKTYDMYQQKPMYTVCVTCKEEQCACEELKEF